jgi:hypothetical protein
VTALVINGSDFVERANLLHRVRKNIVFDVLHDLIDRKGILPLSMKLTFEHLMQTIYVKHHKIPCTKYCNMYPIGSPPMREYLESKRKFSTKFKQSRCEGIPSLDTAKQELEHVRFNIWYWSSLQQQLEHVGLPHDVLQKHKLNWENFCIPTGATRLKIGSDSDSEESESELADDEGTQLIQSSLQPAVTTH